MDPIRKPPRQMISRVTFRRLQQLHRWSGLVLALLLVLIALSGTVLQVIMTVYGDTGPRQAPGEPLWVLGLRDIAVTVHTFAFAGISGLYVGMACALGLLFFAGSGLVIYLELRRPRAAKGKPGLFWRTKAGKGAAMRSLHRWIALPFVPLAVLLAVTGTSLDLYFAWQDMVPLPPPRTPQGAHPMGGPPPVEGRCWHDLSLWLHKFNVLGAFGHVLGILTGLMLTVLALSGIWIYAVLLRQRRKAGMRVLFW